MEKLPDLSALRVELGKKAEAIKANPPRLSYSTIHKLQAIFTDLRFNSDCIDGETPDKRYVTFPYSSIVFASESVELFNALKYYKSIILEASEKLGISQPDFAQIIEKARTSKIIQRGQELIIDI